MLSPEELDRQYNARAAVPDHPAIFARWREYSRQARDLLRCEEDYYYGPSPAETLDFFPAHGTRSPLLIFVHGGYWRALDKSDFSFLAPAFVAAGVSVAILNYGLAPAVRLDDMVRQMLRATTWLHRHADDLKLDRDHFFAAGHSAGGQLAAMMLAADWPAWDERLPAGLVRGAVGVSGLYNLLPLAHAPFLRADLQLDDAAARRVSPVNYPPRQGLPLVTAVGSLESDEFRRQASEIATAWPDCPVEFLPLPGRHHFSAIEALGDTSHPLFHAAVRHIRN